MSGPDASRTPSPTKEQPNWLRTFLGGLASPSASVPEADRPQARLLSYLLLLLALILFILFPVLIFFVPSFRNSTQPFIFVFLILLIGTGYGLSRTRHYLIAASLTVLVTAGAAWVFALTDHAIPSLLTQDLTFLSVSLVLSSLLLPMPATITLSLANLVAVFLLPIFHPSGFQPSQWENLLINLVIVSALAIVAANCRQRNQEQIERRSRALAENEAQLQSILENSTTVIYLKGADGRYLLINRAFETVFNVSREQVVGKTAADIFPKKDAESYRVSDQEVFSTGKSLEVEETADFPDGVRTYITVKFPLRDSDGKTRALGGLSTDITDRKRASEALHQSEERFRLVSYATSDAVWDWDFATDQIWWNQNIRRLFGFRASEVRNDSGWWEAQIHAEDREKVLSSLRQAIDSGQEFWSKEFRFRRADGSYAHVFDRGYVMRDEQGKPVRVLGALMDITQWRQAEEEMESDRNLLRTMIDLLPDNIYIKDTDGRLIVINQADARELGVDKPEDAVGKTIHDFLPPELAAQYTVDDQVVITSGQKIISREEQRLDKDRNPKWFSTTKVPLRDGSGKIIGLVGIGHDITNRKQTEKALEAANQSQTAWIAELERRTRESSLLNEMSDLLQTCPNFEEAYRVIGELARMLFPDEAGGLYIINSSRNLADLVATWGAPLTDPSAFQPNDCWGLRLGRLHVEERDMTGNNRLGDALAVRCNHVHAEDLKASACVPLFAQGDAIGLLHIRRSGDRSGEIWFTDAKQQLARSMGYRVALALANLRLRETLRQQSIRDSLTGLFNRRYMEESLERELHRVIRNKHPLGVIMMDIDRFKEFNDTFGHEAGDTVLREISDLLRSKIRAEDIACRYGGEEFVLILPDASLEITHKRAEMLRDAIKHLDLKYKNKTLNWISISAGVAAFPEQGQSGGEILRAADVALYEAKHAGRDQVMVAAFPSDAPPVFPVPVIPRRPAKQARKAKKE